MAEPCPSDVALELWLQRPDASPHAAHLARCARCEARVALMRQQGEHFARFVFPHTVDAVVATRPRRPWLFAGAALAAATAAGLAAVVLQGPSPDYLGAKGGGLSLRVFVRAGEGGLAVADGATVPATAELRFQVAAEPPCAPFLFSADASGAVARLYPQDEAVAREVGAPTALPGGAVLDGQPGPERFFALCGPVPPAELEGAVRAGFPGGAEAVRSNARLPHLSPGVRQASVLLEKQP